MLCAGKLETNVCRPDCLIDQSIKNSWSLLHTHTACIHAWACLLIQQSKRAPDISEQAVLPCQSCQTRPASDKECALRGSAESLLFAARGLQDLITSAKLKICIWSMALHSRPKICHLLVGPHCNQWDRHPAAKDLLHLIKAARPEQFVPTKHGAAQQTRILSPAGREPHCSHWDRHPPLPHPALRPHHPPRCHHPRCCFQTQTQPHFLQVTSKIISQPMHSWQKQCSSMQDSAARPCKQKCLPQEGA